MSRTTVADGSKAQAVCTVQACCLGDKYATVGRSARIGALCLHFLLCFLIFIYLLFVYYSFVSALKYVSIYNKCEKFYLTICFEDDTVLTTEVGMRF